MKEIKIGSHIRAKYLCLSWLILPPISWSISLQKKEVKRALVELKPEISLLNINSAVTGERKNVWGN